MLRGSIRASRVSRSMPLRKNAVTPGRSIVRLSRPSAKPSIPPFTNCKRQLTTRTPPPEVQPELDTSKQYSTPSEQEQNEAIEEDEQLSPEEHQARIQKMLDEMSPEQLEQLKVEHLQLLLQTAQEPWLLAKPESDEDALRKAWLLCFHILLYLGRPRPHGNVYLEMFTGAPAAPESEIGMARPAILALFRAAAQSLSTIPSTSFIFSPSEHASTPILKAASDMIDAAEALLPQADSLSEQFGEVQKMRAEKGIDGMEDGDSVQEMKLIVDWKRFWGEAQPVALKLAAVLEEAGYNDAGGAVESADGSEEEMEKRLEEIDSESPSTTTTTETKGSS